MARQRKSVRGKRAATCATILEATSKLIAEKGLDGFTISDVARLGGVNRALIYHYFNDRENLLVEAIGHVMEGYDDVPDFGDSSWLENNVRQHIKHPEVARVIYHMLLEGERMPAMWKRLLSGMDSMRKLRDEQGAAFDPEFTTILVALPQLTWAFARTEFARLLGITVEDADRRFIAALRAAAASTIATTMSQTSSAVQTPEGTPQ